MIEKNFDIGAIAGDTDNYREMFNARQLLGLDLSAQRITRIAKERVCCRKKCDNC